MNVWLAALAALAIGTLLGSINGVLVGVFNLPSLAITLGTLAAYRGLAYVILEGEGARTSPAGSPRSAAATSQRAPEGAPRPGRRGRCPRGAAARDALRPLRLRDRLEPRGGALLGHPGGAVRVAVFALSGFMAGCAAIVYLGFFGSVQADAAGGSS